MVIPAATGLIVLVALIGTRFAAPGLSPWPRFWGVIFFALLLWPVSLALVGRMAGRRAQLAAAGAIIFLTGAQQVGAGALPLPLVVRWSVSLTAPGDAIRRELTLPVSGDRGWERAWSVAARAAIAVCTEEEVSPAADVTISLGDSPTSPLTALERTGKPNSVGWYNLPVTRTQIDSHRPLTVLVRRNGATGAPARICGGQDDPTRVGWTGSARSRGGQWLTEQLADIPIPPIGGRVAPSRYYVELRFYDHAGLPHAGVWY